MTLFLLWYGDDYVEPGGSTDSDSFIGVFSSIKHLNDYCESRWFDVMQHKDSLTGFSDEVTRITEPRESDYPYTGYVYFTKTNVDEPNK